MTIEGQEKGELRLRKRKASNFNRNWYSFVVKDKIILEEEFEAVR